MRRVGPYNEPWWSLSLLMLIVVLGLIGPGIYAAVCMASGRWTR